MKIVKTGIAGYGNGGRLFNAAILNSVEGFRISKIMTTDENKTATAKEDFPEAEIVAKFTALINDPEIDLVVITTPNHFHYDLAKKALKAGKHVVVEKPFTVTVDEANELIEIAAKNNLVLSVNHNRRWDSDFLTVRKIVESKKLGEVVDYEAHFDRFKNEVATGWKEDKNNPGSGILYDLGSHLIDQALTLFGSPKEIYADLRKQRKRADVPDNFEVLLYYPNLKVTLKSSFLVKLKGPTYSVHGTKGSFLKYGIDSQEEMLKSGLKPNGNWGWGQESQEIWGTLDVLEDSEPIESEIGDYRKFYQNIYEAITNKAELEVKPEQARDVINVIELAMKSSAEKRVISFSESVDVSR
jgi:scyllo-inositol 2-dehydrogenase (NADP+)